MQGAVLENPLKLLPAAGVLSGQKRCSMAKSGPPRNQPDQDAGKGATDNEQKQDTSYSGQLPHRGADPLTKEYDSDFPEPGSSPEHSGESAKKDPAKHRKRR
jgi:hypothetical protein